MNYDLQFITIESKEPIPYRENYYARKSTKDFDGFAIWIPNVGILDVDKGCILLKRKEIKTYGELI